MNQDELIHHNITILTYQLLIHKYILYHLCVLLLAISQPIRMSLYYNSIFAGHSFPQILQFFVSSSYFHLLQSTPCKKS